MCVVFVGSVEGKLDLEDLGGTQQQLLPFLCAPGAERVLTVTAAVCSDTAVSTHGAAGALPRPQCFHLGFTWLVGTLTLVLGLILVQIGSVAVLFGRVSLHIHRFILPGGGRLGEGPGRSLAPAPFRPRPLSPRHATFTWAVLDAAEAVSQAADLSDDQVDEGVDQLVEDLQVFVLFEAAETLSGDDAGDTGSVTEATNSIQTASFLSSYWITRKTEGNFLLTVFPSGLTVGRRPDHFLSVTTTNNTQVYSFL